MVPAIVTETPSLTEYEYPSKTYHIDFEKNVVCGFIDDQYSIRQSIMLMLSVERYAYIILPRWYGGELERFIGADYDFIKSAIEGEIREALSMDSRILSICDFSIEKVGSDSCLITFTADTQSGAIPVDKELKIV